MEKIRYQGRYLKITEMVVGEHIWEKVFVPDGLVVFPIDQNKNIYFVQERRPHETPSLRIKPVTGIYESEYDIVENTNRELQEELGFGAKEVIPFLSIKSSGTINNLVHFTLAKGLYPSKLPNPDGEDSIVSHQIFSLDQIISELHQGQIPWGQYAVGLFHLQYLLKHDKISL